MKHIHIELEEEIYILLKMYCAEKSMTMRQVITQRLDGLREWRTALIAQRTAEQQ